MRIADGEYLPGIGEETPDILGHSLCGGRDEVPWGISKKRLKSIIREVESNPDIILFIDEFHTIVGAGGGQGSLDAANILKPALAPGELQCIGATTDG